MGLNLILTGVIVILVILLLMIAIHSARIKRDATYYKKQFQLSNKHYTDLYLEYEKLKDSSLS